MRTIRIATNSILAVSLLAGAVSGVAAQSGAQVFTGSIDLSGSDIEGSYTDGEPDLLRGDAAVGHVIETTDKRISGTISRAWNSDWHDVVEPESFFATTSLLRIENDGGAWSGTGTELTYLPDWERFDENDPDTWSALEASVLTGEGDYEGLTAIMHVRPNYDGTMAVNGAVFPGELPPVPESIPAAESVTDE